jgi:DNA processing protein
MTGSSEIRLARAYLSAVAEPPAPALAVFAAALGPVEAAARVRRGEVPDPVGKVTSARREWDRSGEHLLAADKAGARLLIPEDEDWPAMPFLAFDRSSHDESRSRMGGQAPASPGLVVATGQVTN